MVTQFHFISVNSHSVSNRQKKICVFPSSWCTAAWLPVPLEEFEEFYNKWVQCYFFPIRFGH